MYILFIQRKKTPPTPPKKPQQNKNQRTLRRDLVLYSITLLMSFDMIARESYYIESFSARLFRFFDKGERWLITFVLVVYIYFFNLID